MFASIPGVLYAHYISYIDPTSFTVDESIFILSIVIIGGMRNLWGSVFAAAFLILLPEGLRFIGLPISIAANLRQIIYGIILVIMMFKYSKGFKLMKNYSFPLKTDLYIPLKTDQSKANKLFLNVLILFIANLINFY